MLDSCRWHSVARVRSRLAGTITCLTPCTVNLAPRHCVSLLASSTAPRPIAAALLTKQTCRSFSRTCALLFLPAMVISSTEATLNPAALRDSWQLVAAGSFTIGVSIATAWASERVFFQRPEARRAFRPVRLAITFANSAGFLLLLMDTLCEQDYIRRYCDAQKHRKPYQIRTRSGMGGRWMGIPATTCKPSRHFAWLRQVAGFMSIMIVMWNCGVCVAATTCSCSTTQSKFAQERLPISLTSTFCARVPSTTSEFDDDAEECFTRATARACSSSTTLLLLLSGRAGHKVCGCF